MAQTSSDTAKILSYTRLLRVSAVNDSDYCARLLLAHLMVFGKHAPHLYSHVTDTYKQVQADRMLELTDNLPSARMFLISEVILDII